MARFGRGQRPRHSHRHPRRGRRFGRRSHHDPAPRGRKVREHQRRQRLQGVGRPPRRRRLGGQRAVGMAGTDDLARRRGALDEVRSTAMRLPRCVVAAPRQFQRAWRSRRARASPSSPRPRPSRTSPSSISRSWSTATASWPSSIRACASCCATARHEDVAEHDLFYEGGIAAFVKYLDRNKTALLPDPIAISFRTRRHRHRRRAGMERQLLRKRPVLHQQHPAARRRHAPGRVPRGADPHAQQLCREVGAC
jgi:hypothetical protein